MFSGDFTNVSLLPTTIGGDQDPTAVVGGGLVEETLLPFMVVGMMPFFYGAATRLPFIYYVIHLSIHFELSWWTIGLCVGAYQSCRVIINVACIFAPRTVHFIGTAIGFGGYLTVFVCDKDIVAPFIVGTAVIGFSETMACMQGYAKYMFKSHPDRKRSQRMIKYQYASVMIGVMFAFSIGGVVYQSFSINGVALFGMLVEGGELLVLVVYFFLVPPPNSQKTQEEKGQVGEDHGMISIRKDPYIDNGSTSKKNEVAPGESSHFLSRRTKSTETESIGMSSVPAGEISDRFVHEEYDDPNTTVIEFYHDNGTSEEQEDHIEDMESREEYLDDQSDVEVSTPVVDAKPLFDAGILEALESMHSRSSDKGSMPLSGTDTQESLKLMHTKPSDEGSSDDGSIFFEQVIDIQNKDELPAGAKEAGVVDDPALHSGIYRGMMESITSWQSDIKLEVDLEDGSRSLNNDEKNKKFLDASSKSGTVESILDFANENWHTSGIPATWVNYLVCVSFGIESLTIGYNLSIGPIFILTQFDQQTGVTGFLFAIGAGAGAVCSIAVACTERGNRLLRMIAESPYDLCFAMGGIAVGVFIASVSIFPVHLVGLIILMAFNDLGATLLTEFQGSITTVETYSFLSPLGQVVRRTINVVTAVTGPILFGLYPSLPYIVAGTITFLWTIMLAIVFKLRSKRTKQRLARATGRSDNSLASLLSFQTREVLRSVSKHFSSSASFSRQPSIDFSRNSFADSSIKFSEAGDQSIIQFEEDSVVESCRIHNTEETSKTRENYSYSSSSGEGSTSVVDEYSC